MGKKAKQSAKKQIDEPEVDAEEEVQQEKVEKKAKKGAKKGAFDLKDIFSESFRERLSQYIGLNEQVLTLIGEVEGKDKSEQIEARKTQMSERVEQAAADILKLELGSLEDWAGEQQVDLSRAIVSIGKAYDENRSSLSATGSFTESEILALLKPIQKRADEKQAAYDSYNDLIKRSKDIYS